MPDSYGQRPKKADVLTCMRCAKEAGRDGASIRRCGRCNRATYCGKECQTMDWPTHKIECRQIVQEMELLRLTDQLRADGANLPINSKIPTNLSLVIMKKDLHNFVERYRKQFCMSALFALGLTTDPTSGRHTIECFVLTLSYHSDETQLNKRVQYVSGQARTFGAVMKRMRESEDLEAKRDGFIGCVRMMAELDGLSDAVEFRFGMDVTQWVMGEMVWEANLKRLLAA